MLDDCNSCKQLRLRWPQFRRGHSRKGGLAFQSTDPDLRQEFGDRSDEPGLLNLGEDRIISKVSGSFSHICIASSSLFESVVSEEEKEGGITAEERKLGAKARPSRLGVVARYLLITATSCSRNRPRGVCGLLAERGSPEVDSCCPSQLQGIHKMARGCHYRERWLS